MAGTEKIVLITGAARGLGLALTELYLSKGWQVIATDVGHAEIQKLSARNNILLMTMDVTSDESVRLAFTAISHEKIVLDLIIHSAGIDSYFPLSEAPVEQFRDVFEVNLFGGYRVNQVFLPLLKKPGGRIIHISSESLNLTIPFMPYPITKKALEGYAKILRQELKFSGIDVILIRPGAVRTQLLETVRNLKSAVGSRQSVAGSQHIIEPFRRFASIASGEIGKTISPEKAASFIYHLSLISKPSAVYRINNMLKLKLASLLPFRLTEVLVRKKLLKRPPGN